MGADAGGVHSLKFSSTPTENFSEMLSVDQCFL